MWGSKEAQSGFLQAKLKATLHLLTGRSKLMRRRGIGGRCEGNEGGIARKGTRTNSK